MARTITVSPVIPSDGGSYELLARSIQAGQEAKRRREEALQDAILTQQKTNQAVFGNVNAELRKFYTDASSVPTDVRNKIFEAGVAKLKSAVGSPDFYNQAQNITNQAFQYSNAYNNFYKAAEEVSKGLAEQYSMDPKAILSFANKSVFDEVVNPDGTVSRSLKDVSGITNPAQYISEQVLAHPELYVDQAKLTSSAFKEMEDLEKNDAVVSNKLTYDPTGKKVLSLGYEYKISPFEREVERKDTTTGLTYKVPALAQVDTTVTVPGEKFNYKELDPVKYEGLDKTVSPKIKQKITIGALEKIREHNARVFKQAGSPDPISAALAVSKENVASFKGVPGFINPFEQSNVDQFKRIYAVDFLKLAKQYNENGEQKGIKIDAGLRVDTPKAPTVISTGQQASQSGLSWMQKMDAAIKSKDASTVDTLLTALYGGSGKKVSMAKTSNNSALIQYEGPKDTREFISVGGKMQLNPDFGKSSSESISIDLSDPNAIKKMGGAYQTIMGADKLVEGYVVGKSSKLP